MTVKEFWEKVDAIDLDSRDDGRYTDDEMYDIGCAFIEMNNSQKRELGGWDGLIEILKPLDAKGEPMTKGDTFRQWVKNRRYAKDEMVHNERMLSGQNVGDMSFEDFEAKTEELKQSLYKQQVKTRDTMNAYRRTVRSAARAETFQDMVIDAVKGLSPLPEAEPYQHNGEGTGVEAVMLLSDLHIGMKIDNFANKYDSEIARKRLMTYVDETIRLCRESGVQRLNVENLNDAIDGNIHVTGRIEQEQDVVEQIMTASEMLAEALNRLQEAAPEVIYRGVTDNHSRATQAYKDNIEKENFSRLIDFYLKARLGKTGVVFADDNLDCDISRIDLLNGKTMICVHGHHDSPNRSLQAYVGALRQYIDYVCMGHFHESKMKSFQGAKVFVNGSICGNSQYGISKRLFGDPEQTLLIFDGRDLKINIVNLLE